MTRIIQAFDHTLIKLEVPKEIYESKSLKNDIDHLFNSEIILTKGALSKEQRGIAYSTCPIGDNSLVINLSGVFPLVDYVTNSISTQFYNNTNKQIVYSRIWINKMFKNCSGICHKHITSNIDGVVIFYYNVPENGSKFIVLKDDIKGEVTEEHRDISHYNEVKTGDLIIHKNDVPHAVSEHMNDDPRICFVFEFGEKIDAPN